ncbi:MAG: hypothetical protein ABIC82_02210 [bacterium]
MLREIKKEDLSNIETTDEAVARRIFYKEFELLGDKLKSAESKLKDINYILLSVVIILLVMVATLIIDSFHFNSATYKEYSEKTESVEQTQKINQELLDQNQKNQQLILDQQKQIQQYLMEKK